MQIHSSADSVSTISEFGDLDGIPITTILNENWRGKTDPIERRRIQNRLNQRAFRDRRRAGQSPKQYKQRTQSESSSQRRECDDSIEGSESGAEGRPSGPLRTVSAPVGDQRLCEFDAASDELARTINRNLIAAAVTNARHLGLDMTALKDGTPVLTRKPSAASVPASLTPVELQYRVPHDPIIDTIPHARLRFNVLRAIVSGQLPSAGLSACIRGSGTFEQVDGSWQRTGLVVWADPKEIASWELSEPFVRRWRFLLQGCEDLIAATNVWRSRRGEQLFPLTIEEAAASQ
ncbi:hypothetical protein LTR08_002304 [Meristemomyces frigidus]|nr:hypothetical protein LTR08_002304 [Meristemomyces frigidus]